MPFIRAEDLSGLIAAASDIALSVSRDGTILSVITDADDTGFGDLSRWQGRPVEDVLTVESIPKFQAVLERFLSGDPPDRPVELNHTDGRSPEFPVRYRVHAPGSDEMFFMLGRDLRSVAEAQQQLVQAQMSLEQGYEARREFDVRYRLLMRMTLDPILFVSVGRGRIKDLNDPAAALLGTDRESLIGAPFAEQFRDRRQEEFIEGLVNAALSETSSGVEVSARRSRKKIDIVPRILRAAGERIPICRIRATDDPERQLDELGPSLRGLYDKGADAVVFTAPTGVITSCNNAFLDLTDSVTLADVKGRSLSDYLSRGQVDLSVLIDNACKAGPMRIYATRISSDLGVSTAVEISTTRLDDRADGGLAFVLRDASRLETMRSPSPQGTDDANRSVMELVGSASLKEIVSETTDVIEKMCIETAVTLTRNNRVAAAEMLGLSRQSLYVKLRKYGLLNKDFDAE
ncbi:transcriptional regulator PpsR [Allosediminivita pacifica]|uniref:Transcriptional regulator PpsR n=1 Tax=Allosediminivita pacifica TaxID=1267769 RepID=A0A2T6B5N3_9RHOB|nr:transcriptional regulator PpsR [Allosediminivita pacifica]PTX51391.1 transcriptional regulator PpsR [Allosediminivita pacifica]GGA99465.1 transcriptional regulator PpsR [Allosediminivita pacifica]